MNDHTLPKDVFISYNRADLEWARDLAERIESETADGTPGGRKLTAFFAPWDIEYGQNFVNRLNEGLCQARFFAPVLSPEFFSSGWTNFEWTDQVAVDPMNLQNKIIPLFRRDVTKNGRERISFPAPFNVLNRIDFREGQDYDASFSELIRILQGRPKARGSVGSPTVLRPHANLSARPAPDNSIPASIAELLIGNLLKIEKLPERIWSGSTSAREPKDVYDSVETREAFVLSDKRIYAFCDLADRNCSLNPVVLDAKDINSEPLTSWLNDDIKRVSLVRLLNQCVKQYAYKLFIRKDEKGRYYFLPDYIYSADGNEERTAVSRFLQLPGETKPRAVAALKTNPIDQRPFWVHYAARLRIEILGSDFFLRIEPTYIFTKDGRTPLDGKSVGRLSIQWTGKQQNIDVLHALLFWARALAEGRSEIRIPSGKSSLIMRWLPCHTHTTFGVGGDYVRIGALRDDPVEVLDQIASEAQLVERDDEDSQSEEDDEAEKS